MKSIHSLIKEKEHLLASLLNTIPARHTEKTDSHLRISNVKGRPSYYYCSKDPNTNQRTEQYIRKKDLSLAAAIAQQEYDQKIYQLATRQLFLVKRFLKEYDERALEDIFQKLHPARKSLIQPRVPDWDSFLNTWYHTCASHTLLQPEEGFETENGELVRSKSEKIIADKYFKHNIHYQYEKSLTLFDGDHPVTLHPDFTLLKKGDFQEYYHEHFGMMDNPDYCRSAIRKISIYRKNGIFEGERLFITFESSLQPLNTRDLDLLIQHHLM